MTGDTIVSARGARTETGVGADRRVRRNARLAYSRAMMAGAAWWLQAFYAGVALAALIGQSLAAQEWLHWPLIAAAPAVLLVELGGIALCAFADARRRLGERAVFARLLSALVATGAVVLNWLGHEDHLAGGFFAGLSALGYTVWLLTSEARRRDQLREDGDLAPTPPAYELWSHWLLQPLTTMRARSMAKADPDLDLYGSIAAARAARRREARNAALATAVRALIRRAADPTLAEIAVLTYDVDEIAARLRAGADYDGLTAILAERLRAPRIADAAGVRERDASALVRAGVLTSTALALAPATDPQPDEVGDVGDGLGGEDVASVPTGRWVPGAQGAGQARRVRAGRRRETGANAGPRGGSLAAAAAERYLATVRSGRPLTGRELGAEFERSQAWGRTVIGTVKAARSADGGVSAGTDAGLLADAGGGADVPVRDDGDGPVAAGGSGTTGPDDADGARLPDAGADGSGDADGAGSPDARGVAAGDGPRADADAHAFPDAGARHAGGLVLVGAGAGLPVNAAGPGRA